MEDFKRWLTNLVEDWLLIIDNADDLSLDILPCFPPSCRGTIIVTTRNPDCKIHATVGSRDIGAMNREEAISLLLKASGEPETESSLRIRALPVVETLWSLALAIIQAAAVIRQKLYTFEDYYNAYITRRKELLSFRPVQASSDYEFTVYTTWEVSKASIKAIANGRNATQEASQTATNALELLTLFGFCHFDDIWEDFFKVAWGNVPYLSALPWWRSITLQTLREDRPPEWDPFPFRQAVSLLSSYSLIQWSDLRVSLHPLVHSWIRDSLVEKVQLRHWTSSLSTLAMMNGSSKRPFSYHRRLMPHIQSCLGVRDLKYLLIEDSVAKDRAYISSFLLDIYASCSQPEELLRLSESALEYTRKTLGEGHRLTWEFMDYNTLAHNDLDQYQETIKKLETRVEEILLPPSPVIMRNTIAVMRRLLIAYNGLKHTKKALNLGEKLVPLCIDTQGEDDEITFNVTHELSSSYRAVGRLEEALDLCKRMIERQKTFLSDDNHELLWSKHELAVTYIEMGLYQEAVDVLRHVVEKSKIVLADDHVDTLVAQGALAIAYGRLGQPATGIPLVVNAIGLGEKAGVPDASLRLWRRSLARLQAHEAQLHWERRTEPFQPEVVISLLAEAIEMGEKSGIPDEVLQNWREGLQHWQSHEGRTLSEQELKPSTPEPKNRKRRRTERG